MKSGVIGIILDGTRSSALWLKRRDVPVWVLPGGGIDSDESSEEAIVREMEEEIGCRVKILRQIAEYTPQSILGSTVYTYLCQIDEGIPSSGPETLAIGFFPIENPPVDCFHIHYDFLQDAYQNHTEILRKPLSQVSFGRFLYYFLCHPLRVLRFALSKTGWPINNS